MRGVRHRGETHDSSKALLSVTTADGGFRGGRGSPPTNSGGPFFPKLRSSRDSTWLSVPRDGTSRSLHYFCHDDLSRLLSLSLDSASSDFAPRLIITPGNSRRSPVARIFTLRGVPSFQRPQHLARS
jgi:hypothetical protein